ncbi:MAG: hypothetical protein Sylvanvirus7_30 [Sylvanvirus sp.]|uniref:Methyltransferase type 11 domain-containing protein n=1 Tax=Sylvanvirus sp. TaxID=2487774 RepID=A0A3G5AHP3_9VIRU|nr:MAG: hypothetical protein Sylvanvirus7_30 [Sylvanvirus sp.]
MNVLIPLVPVWTRYQLQYLKHSEYRPSDHHLHQRFKQILGSPLHNCINAQALLWKQFELVSNQPSRLSIEILKELRERMTTFIQAHQCDLRHPMYELIRYLDRRCKTDEEIYQDLRLFVTDMIRPLPESAQALNNEEGRSQSRVKDLAHHLSSCLNPPSTSTPLSTRFEDIRSVKSIHSIHSIKPIQSIQPTQSIQSFLDIGCGDGTITKAIAQLYHIPPQHAHGCDIYDVQKVDVTPSQELKELKEFEQSEQLKETSITFTLLQDTTSKNGEKVLPYESESFDVVFALMSFHHMKNVEATIQDLYRVLRPHGVLILREHDLYLPNLSVVLDVVHGLYDRVWNKHACDISFSDTYYAHYRSRDQWQRLLEQSRFVMCPSSPDRKDIYRVQLPAHKFQLGRYIHNPIVSYYGVYHKTKIHPISRIQDCNSNDHSISTQESHKRAKMN